MYSRRLFTRVNSEALIIAGQPCTAQFAHTPVSLPQTGEQTNKGIGKDENEEGGGGGVEWLEQLLVKDLSQSITSVPFVAAETGEGVTQTCLRLPTADFAEDVYACLCVRCRPVRHTRSLFSNTNDFLNTEVRVTLVWVVSDWVGG